MKIKEISFLNPYSSLIMVIGITLISISLLALIGWQYPIPVLTNISTSWTSMKVNTAVCFLLSGIILLLMYKKKLGVFPNILVNALSLIVLLISSMTIIKTVTGVDFDIGQLFIKESSLLNQGSIRSGHMTSSTALGFIFTACAFLLRKQTSGWLSQIFAWLIFFTGLFSFYNYIYGANIQYIIAFHTTMGMNTSVLFILLSLGILLIHPDTGIVEIILRNSTGGYYLRRILPFLLLVPMLLVIIELRIERLDLIEEYLGDSIIAAGIFIILAILMLIIVIRMDREEKKLITAKENILQNEMVFHEFAENVDIVFYRISPDMNTMLYISPAYEKIWGRSTESLYKNPMAWFDSIISEDQQIVQKQFIEVLRKGDKLHAFAEYRIARPDGSIRNIFSRASQLKDQNNNVFCVVGIAIDMTDENLEKKYLQTQHDILHIMEHEKTIYDVAPKILQVICKVFDWDLGEIWMADEQNNILRRVNVWHKDTEKLIRYSNESQQHSFSFSEGLPGKVWKEKKSVWLQDYSSRQEFSRSVDAEKAELNCTFCVPIIFQDKVFGIMEFFSYQIKKPDDQLLSLMSSISKLIGEFIQRVHTNAQIQIASRHDILTGLLNRAALEEELDNIIYKIKSKIIAIIILDIDRFRLINEAYGHDLGDTILKSVAQRLAKLIDHEKTNAARLGSNKFILYYNNAKDVDDILDYAHKIERTFKEPFQVNQKNFFLTATLGIAIYPQDGGDGKTLITNANLAMIDAKSQGGNTSVFFTNELPAIAIEKLSMHADLRQAIAKNQFFLNYQPQINLKTEEICGVEALIRWQHPTKGLISPDDFIACAAETGLITALNEHIIRIVFQQLKSNWTGPPVSINISAQQFKNKFFLVEYLESLIKEFGVNPKNIELEITEDMLMEDTQHSLAVLGALYHIGFRFAIDDFGTGFSSFNYLYRIPADKIKIDRSFISGLPENKANAVIVKSMISMIHSLGKKVVAEGAETEAEVDFLKQEKCDIVQGYYYYKPMLIDKFIDLLAKLNEGKKTIHEKLNLPH